MHVLLHVIDCSFHPMFVGPFFVIHEVLYLMDPTIDLHAFYSSSTVAYDKIFGYWRGGGKPAAFAVVRCLILRLKFPVIEWGRWDP